MTHFILTLLSCVIVAVNALTILPEKPRFRRNVSELFTESNSNYLPPQPTQDTAPHVMAHDTFTKVISHKELKSDALVATAIEFNLEHTAVVGDKGYEYKSPVPRKQRDVSHLTTGYLPPSQLPPTEYLPPSSSHIVEDLKPSTSYLPPLLQQEVEISNETTQNSNEYNLPQNITPSDKISDEAPQPSSEYLPPEKLEEVHETSQDSPIPQVEEISETATEAAAKLNVAIKMVTDDSDIKTTASYAEETTAVADAETENGFPATVEETAFFASDGYHYKRPSVIPAELFEIETTAPESFVTVTREYLPPLPKGILEAEGSSDTENVILANDGYHYRVTRIKRQTLT